MPGWAGLAGLAGWGVDFTELDFKELDFKELLGVLGYLLGVLGYLMGVPI